MKLSMLLTFALTMASLAAHAEPEYEVTCRMKAKELAAESYRGCITENKTAMIEQIRKEYQDKLKNLKEQYDGEIRKLGAKKAEGAKFDAPKAESSRSRVAKLPSKRPSRKAQPTAQVNVQNEDADMTVEVRSTSNKLQTPIDESSMDLPEPIPVEN